MAGERLTRATPAHLELRGVDGRTIVGRAVPFDEPAQVFDFETGRLVDEIFRKGAFKRTIQERGARVKLMVQHDRQRLPIGRAVSLTEQADGLIAEFAVSRIALGDEVLELVRDGALDSLSIGFRPVTDRWSKDRTVIERLEVALHEVSVVDQPSYDGARITGLRSAPTIPVDAARQRLQLAQMRFT